MANLGKSTLGRKKAHRQALLIQGSNALIKHKNIFTTKIKAKMIARYLAPIITKARRKMDTDFLHAKRRAFALLKDKKSVQTLFSEILPKVGDRPGGYTRIITLSNRPGDDKTRVLLELVDYNMLYSKGAKTKTTRRSRRKTKGVEATTGGKETDQKSAALDAKQEKVASDNPTPAKEINSSDSQSNNSNTEKK